jgi:hypothetical protein
MSIAFLTALFGFLVATACWVVLVLYAPDTSPLLFARHLLCFLGGWCLGYFLSRRLFPLPPP